MSHEPRRQATSVSAIYVLNSQTVSKERPKEKEAKQITTKKKSEEVKHILKEKSVSESRTKDNKQRTGKSYLEERQRQAERREEQRKKLSQSQNSDNLPESESKTESLDKSVTDEDKKLEEKSSADNKDVEFKKEKSFQKEVKKSSHKYSSNKDKEPDEPRKTRRTNVEKPYSSNKKDYEKSEDSGRKRYSESRKSQDSTYRDRYKDKDKTKLFSQKKSSSSTTDIDQSKNTPNDTVKASGSNDPNKVLSKVNKENIDVPDEESIEISSISVSNNTIKESNKKLEKLFETKDKINPIRRKSLDYEKNRYSINYPSSKVHAREKFTEKKRRNSVGSNNPNKESKEVSSYENNRNLSPSSIQKALSKENIFAGQRDLSDMQFETEDHKNTYETENVKDDEEKNNFKRRSSTGDAQDSVKEPTRRNSLGSEYKRNIGVFTKQKQKTSSKETTKKDKVKYEKKTQQSNRDPRTERRIRNKDRPSIEIYRPGMGKFSKQRLEREKVLGSSTEMESPSSSPSPTPVLKHKTLATH